MSCCGSKNSNYYTRQNCCNYNYRNTSCASTSNEVSCCNNNSSYNNSCCNNNNNTYNNSCCSNNSRTSNNSCCNNNNNDYNCAANLSGLSCPFHSNNDSCCQKSLKDALCSLTNQRVIIHIDGCKMCVIIVSVGDCFIKAINPCTQKIVYFNINRIDNVEDVLPRCY